MARLHLRCKDKQLKGKEWLLELSPAGGRLVDHTGGQQALFSHAEAERRFVFPSFWQSVEHLGVLPDSGKTVWFYPDRGNLDAIRNYLGKALATQGPDAIQALQRAGLLQVLGGSAIMALAIAATAISLIQAYSNPQGGTVVFALGCLIVGGALFARGLNALGRARRATSELDQIDEKLCPVLEVPTVAPANAVSAHPMPRVVPVARHPMPETRTDEDVADSNTQATAAFWCGIVGLCPVLGLLLGPAAVVLGAMGAMGGKKAWRYNQETGKSQSVLAILLGLFAIGVNWVALPAIGIMLFAAFSNDASRRGPGRNAIVRQDPKGNLVPVQNPPPIQNPAPTKKPPIVEEPVRKGKTYLSDLKELEVKHKWWPLGKNGELGSPNFHEIAVNGQHSPKGLGLHVGEPFVYVKYRLGGKYQSFVTTVAIDDCAPQTTPPVRFDVLGDGKLLWSSKVIQGSRLTDRCEIKIEGVNVLELRASQLGLNHAGGYTVWVDPYVFTAEE